jgi:hypothetical protein
MLLLLALAHVLLLLCCRALHHAARERVIGDGHCAPPHPSSFAHRSATKQRMASPAPADAVAEANDATGTAAPRELFASAGLSGSAPGPPVRPPPGTRVFVAEPPVHLTCPICHDAFKDVRGERRCASG